MDWPRADDSLDEIWAIGDDRTYARKIDSFLAGGVGNLSASSRFSHEKRKKIKVDTNEFQRKEQKYLIFLKTLLL